MTQQDTAQRKTGGHRDVASSGSASARFIARSFQTDKAWADGFWPEVKRVILTEALPKIARVTVADLEDDAKRCTDYLLSVTTGRIACRIRGSRYWQRADLTLRLSRPSGAETEVSKLRKGLADWYFCGWGDGGELTAWALVDVAKMLPLLDHPRKVYVNHTDGVKFVAVSLAELAQAGAVSAAGGLAAGYVSSWAGCALAGRFRAMVPTTP